MPWVLNTPATSTTTSSALLEKFPLQFELKWFEKFKDWFDCYYGQE
jgi:hypothetical protein